MTLVRSVSLVLLFTVPVLAQDANESREQRRERNFTQRDTNKDGRISREEFSGNAANFDRRDSNKDGFISREEFGLNPTPPEREYTEEEQRMLTKPSADQAVRYEPINDPAKFWTPAIVAKVQGKVSRFQTPLLVLHGDVHPLKHVNMDYIIPAIRDGGKTIEVKIYPGKDHGFYWGRRVDEAFVVAMIEDIHSFAVPLLKTKPVLMDQKFYSKK